MRTRTCIGKNSRKKRLADQQAPVFCPSSGHVVGFYPVTGHWAGNYEFLDASLDETEYQKALTILLPIQPSQAAACINTHAVSLFRRVKYR